MTAGGDMQCETRVSTHLSGGAKHAVQLLERGLRPHDEAAQVPARRQLQ